MQRKYDESAIQTLDALSHIRLRPGMYIGRLGDGSNIDDGIYILLKEIIDNAVDEFIMKSGNKIVIGYDQETQKISIRDHGRGIPLGKVIECASLINTGAKYSDDVFQFSVGLNGVGLKAVNALSSHFLIQSNRDGKAFEASFKQGKLESKKEFKTKDANGVYVEFIADPEIFKKYKYNIEFIRKRLWTYAFLNHGLTLYFEGEAIQSEHGLIDLLNTEVSENRLYEPLSFRDAHLEFAFLHTESYGEVYFSYVNGQYTSDGGTHLIAFKEGFTRAINEYSKKNYQAVDIREGLVAAIAVRLKNPVFESQTKNKLANPEIKGEIVQKVQASILALLYQNKEAAKELLERIAFNEKLRKELAAVKKEAKEKQKKIYYNIPKLRDSKYHYNDDSLYREETMIFLTEGESASASIVASRNPLTQAIYSLRGKPLNVYGMKLDQLYKNEEMYNLMMALNIEEDTNNLRFNKVVLATDADVDGMHIRNLLLTFFLTYFEALVSSGHLYILKTPLFKVRYKDKTIYCFDIKEKDEAIATLTKKASEKSLEITRFKGLGELSPHEFKQFIGPEMQIDQVTLAHLSDVPTTLNFYMGKNTPERKAFIMQNLIYEEKL